MKHVKVVSRGLPNTAQTGDAKNVFSHLGFWDWWVIVTQVLIWVVSWLESR